MSLNDVGSFDLLHINLAAAAGLAFIDPLLIQLDLSLFGPFGLASVEADIAAQFNAALASEADLTLVIVNPLDSLQLQISALAQALASFQAVLALGIPVISLDILAQIAASVSLSASLGIRIGGINAFIDAALSLKLPAAQFSGDLAAQLSAGPIALLSFDPTGATPTLLDVGNAIQAEFSTALPGPINFFDPVYGVLLVTKSPSAWAAIQATLRTA